MTAGTRGPQKVALARWKLIRSEVWRAVRDSGIQGMPTATVVTRFQSVCSSGPIYERLGELESGGYIVRRNTKACWQVTADCRVPCGELPVLGPGWTGDDAALVAPELRVAA